MARTDVELLALPLPTLLFLSLLFAVVAPGYRNAMVLLVPSCRACWDMKSLLWGGLRLKESAACLCFFL